ncbi:MAG: 50S ribosomal protein L9 [Gemmatimonadota bacterium]
MARNTEVILRTEVQDLGQAGDVVDVAPGYARNYLLPRGLAFAATASNKQRIEQEKKRAQDLQRETQAEAEALGASMAGLELTFTENAGDEDQLYGSVSAADIAEQISRRGFAVERTHVRLEQPIKALGSYDVPIRLHPEVVVNVLVQVVREG